MSFKINLDCMKDVMIYLQEHLDYEETEYNTQSIHKEIDWYNIYTDKDLRERYNEKDIKYSLEKLREINYITTSTYNYNKEQRVINCFAIDDITIDGHNFISNASNKTIWNNAKKRIKKIGEISMPLFTKLLFEEGISLIKMGFK